MAITFSDPQYLWLLSVLPLFLVTHFSSLRFVKKRALRFANFEAIERVSGKKKISTNWLILILRLLVITSLIAAAAGSVFWFKGKSSDNNYVLALDASGSMLASDLKPNRLEAAKDSALLFVDTIDARAKIGIVSFSGLAQIEAPLMSDLIAVRSIIQSVEFSSIHGTAIGDAIKVSLGLFTDVSKPNIIILLTDGRENVLSDEELERILLETRQANVQIHTIAVGTAFGGEVPGLNYTSSVYDTLLKRIASATGGSFYSAENSEQLGAAYKDIATVSESSIPFNLRIPLILLAIGLIFFEWGLLNTKYKTIP